MAFDLNSILNWLFGPGMPYLIVIGLIAFVIFLIITRKPRLKEYKEIELAKRIRDDLNMQYKYFGEPVGVPLLDGTRKAAHVIGKLDMVWNEKQRRFENLVLGKITLPELDNVSKELYSKPFTDLSDNEKRSVRQVVRADKRDQYVELEAKKGEKVSIKGFKKEIEYDKPVEVVALKVATGAVGRLIAALLPRKAQYFILNKEQVQFAPKAVYLKKGLQPQPYYWEVIFSNAAKDTLDNTAFKIEREQNMQATANMIPRVIYFNTTAAERAMFQRETADIESKKYRSQKESAQD